VQIIK